MINIVNKDQLEIIGDAMEEVNKALDFPREHIKVKGFKGKWYVIDETDQFKDYGHIFLLEHETYGDETAHIIVDDMGNLLLDDVWNGWEDFEDMIAWQELKREMDEEI